MKLVRIGPAGAEVPGALVDDDTFVDLSDVVGDFNEAFFGSGALASLPDVVAGRVADGRVESVGGRRFGAPIAVGGPITIRRSTRTIPIPTSFGLARTSTSPRRPS